MGICLASTAMSYGIMAGFVNGIKYTAKEMRPNGSTANSWPSGHIATAFVGATILQEHNLSARYQGQVKDLDIDMNAYKDIFAWKVFFDWDTARRTAAPSSSADHSLYHSNPI